MTYAQQWLIHCACLAARRQAEAQVEVFPKLRSLVEATDLPKQARFGENALHHHQGILGDHVLQNPSRSRVANPASQGSHEGSSFIDVIEQRVAPPTSRRRLTQRGDLALELGREPDVVRVQEREELTARAGDADIARTRWAARMVDADHLQPFVHEAVEDIMGVVGRTVIDHDHLEVSMALVQYGVDRGGQEPGSVERGDDDAHTLWWEHYRDRPGQSGWLGPTHSVFADIRERGHPTSMSSRTPNLLLVGAPRCGTTALHTYLGAHPSVYMSPVKELHYFSTDLYQPPPQARIANHGQYLAMFEGATDEPWVGEASPFYLYSSVAAEAIKTLSADARVIITLRNPVDMMYSMYCLRVRAAMFHAHQETLPSFEEALAAGPARLRGEALPPGAPTEPGRCLYLCYRELGRYSDRVARFLEVFGRQAVHAVVFEDLLVDTAATHGDVCRFLGIDSAIVPDSNLTPAGRAAGAAPRSGRLARLLWRPPRHVAQAARALLPRRARRSLRDALQRWNDRRPPELAPETRRRLLDECTPDVLRLSELLDRDLTPWLREDRADA